MERSLLTSIAQNVPRAMEEFRKRLDDGITLDRDRAVISLDHGKIFQRNKMEENITEMTLFLSLGDSPFKDFIEHPLCQSFLYSKFKKVIWFFVIALMMPHFLFSGLHLETLENYYYYYYSTFQLFSPCTAGLCSATSVLRSRMSLNTGLS